MKVKCPDCCFPEKIDNRACGCCEGVEAVTPLAIGNRPGLSKIVHRIGTHADFLTSMMARLSSVDYPELAGLTTRDPADPSIAWLDAWATVADVLTFYQERIANEGYLHTAGERRSILELARLVGYKLRPGVAATVFLAYTLDDKMEDEVTIAAGSRVQSIPGPDELPQSFETSEVLKARSKWNNLKPRMTKPQTADTILSGIPGDPVAGPGVYLKGINTNLKTNDPILIDRFGNDSPEFYRVKQIDTDADADRTLIMLDIVGPLPNETLIDPVDFIKDLTKPPTPQLRNALRLKRTTAEQFKEKSEIGYSAVKQFAPVLDDHLSRAAAHAKVAPDNPIRVYALRQTASLLGHNHPGTPNYIRDEATGMIEVTSYTPPNILKTWPEYFFEDPTLPAIAVEPQNQNIVEGSWVVIDRPLFENTGDGARVQSIHRVKSAQSATHAANGVSAKATFLNIEEAWFEGLAEGDIKILIPNQRLLSETTVYLDSEELELAEAPIEESVCGNEIPVELDGFYDGLESGRWVIVSGERDISGTSGVRFSELAMLSSVTQDVAKESTGLSSSSQEPQALAGEKTHTYITLANNLAYCFKRETVTIYGNVVKATHGETRQEVLGSGDGSKTFQSFELKQFPLTHVSASNPTGVDSTLKLVVNDLQWHEADSLAGLKATDRQFITKTDDDDKTTVTFGNGREGARLPTGVENVRAQYRNGIGKPGNVNAEQISLLVTKPLAVKEVINPLRASGGADREPLDSARKNAPLAVQALDRLVSVQDYEYFSRIYAGIGKARAVEMSDGRRQIVHVTIAGADDIPIDETSDLFINLLQSLHDFGDPFQPIRLAVRELMMMVISARLRLAADYQWEPVVERVREAMLDAFGFESRELGQDVLLSEVISTIQAVRGVAYVDVDVFGGIPEKISDVGEPGERRLLTPDEITARVQALVGEPEEVKQPEPRLIVNLAGSENGVMWPAQLAFLTPDVPETLILNQIE